MGNPAYGAGKAAAEEAAKATLKLIVPVALGIGSIVGAAITNALKNKSLKSTAFRGKNDL